jgi:hypothetical protein
MAPDGQMPAFLEGAIAANLAWMTVWPLDVVKSQLQSGNYAGKSMVQLLGSVYKSGLLMRGLIPGLARSSIANGCAMVVYKKTEAVLKELRDEPVVDAVL